MDQIRPSYQHTTVDNAGPDPFLHIVGYCNSWDVYSFTGKGAVL